MKADAISGAYIPAVDGSDLLAAVPDIHQYASVVVSNVFNIAFSTFRPR